jgi:hypothetical protein
MFLCEIKISIEDFGKISPRRSGKGHFLAGVGCQPELAGPQPAVAFEVIQVVQHACS